MNKKPMWIRYRNAVATALGALAAQTAISIGTVNSIKVRARMPSEDIWLNVSGLTATEGHRLVVGIAHGSLSVTEIAEALAAGGDSPRDAPGAERSRRPLKLYGNLAGQGQQQDAAQFVFEGHFKVNLTFEEEEGWFVFVFNNSNTALTTGGVANLIEKAYLVAV